MEKQNIQELAETLNKAGIPPRFEPEQARFLIRMWQQVAQGRPVSIDRINAIGADEHISRQKITEFIAQVSERDKSGNVVGIVGLSQNKHPHSLTINGQTLSTWCAWDSLFLPGILKQRSKIESTCPVTKNRISITIGLEKVERFEPRNTAVSIVIPDVDANGIESVEKIWMIFCHQVHFFSSSEVASKWISEKGINARVLSVPEAFELGRLAFKDLHKYA
jgi:alkylmercury lyase